MYHNPRFGFEFPYPSNWVTGPMPDSRDGQTFSDPTSPTVEIRGWAGFNLEEFKSPNTAQPLKQNFTTAQGLTGDLEVEVGTQISMMTLILNQGSLRYYWQGRAPSKQFAEYYRFFYYSASQYRLPVARSGEQGK